MSRGPRTSPKARRSRRVAAALRNLPVTDDAGRYPGHHCVGRDVAGHDASRGNHRAVAQVDPCEDQRGGADPATIAYSDVAARFLERNLGNVMPGGKEAGAWADPDIVPDLDPVPGQVAGIDFYAAIEADVVADFDEPGEFDIDPCVIEDAPALPFEHQAITQSAQRFWQQAEQDVIEVQEIEVGVVEVKLGMPSHFLIHGASLGPR